MTEEYNHLLEILHAYIIKDIGWVDKRDVAVTLRALEHLGYSVVTSAELGQLRDTAWMYADLCN